MENKVYRHVLHDERISFKAKGLFYWLALTPSNGNFPTEKLSLVSSDGRERIASGVRELKKFGYLNVIRQKENGKWCGSKFELTEFYWEEKEFVEN